MIERIMRLALSNRPLVLFLVAMIIGIGILAVRTIPIDAFPDVTNVQVEVVSNAPGLSPLEIERSVTYPLETAMRGLPGLVTMRSITKYGLTVVTLVFRDDVDVYFARQLVFERLSSVREGLPAGVDTEMGPIATAMGEIYQYTLEGRPPADPEEKVGYLTRLRTIEDWVVAPLLKGIPGVNEINSFGGYIKEYQVLPDPEKLLKYGLTVGDIHEALRINNANVGGGYIDRASEQFIIRGIGLIGSLADIGNIIVKTDGHIPVFVRDVAEVRIGYSPRQGLCLKNGRNEAVGGIVMMLKGENSLEVVRRVEEKVQEINSGNMLPPGIALRPYYDRSEIVKDSVATVLRALAEGAFLALVILYLLLGNIRGALIVVLTLPLSLLLAFIVMRTAGVQANLMSLGGLAISIGMIIDATIIQVENVQRHLTELSHSSGQKLATVLRAVMEVRKPSIFGELIIALTFVPIISLQGMEGKMFAPLALTVATALFASLCLSIVVIPVLCAMFLKGGREGDNRFLRGVKRLYFPMVRLGLKAPLAVVAVTLVLMVPAALLIPRLGTEFIPIMDEGAFDMDFQLMPGVSLEKAGEIAGTVHERLLKFPEMVTLVSRTGQTGIALEARGVDKTGFTGILKPKAEWTSATSKEMLTEKMRAALADIPGMAFSFSQPIQCRIDELVAGTRAQIIAKLYGDDIGTLKAKTAEIARVLSGVRGLSDLIVEKISGQPYIEIRVDRDRISRYGVNVADVLDSVETAIGGKTATRVFEENRTFDLTVRLPEDRRDSIEKIQNLLVRTGSGANLPLNQLADIAFREGPVQISREDGRRRMGVEVNISGRDIGSFVAEARRKIRQQVQLPAGYTLAWGGQFENQQQAMKRLGIIMPVVIVLILLLLFVTFHSAKPAGLVFLNLPFALMGGVVALWVSGLYLSVPASVGFIVLFGVAVLNGLVLMSHIVQLRSGGLSAAESALQACSLRLRPILMTASITVFSLVPMLFATGPGSEIQKPLAVVVIGGLFTSTLATLLVLPAMYCWVDRRKEVNPDELDDDPKTAAPGV